MASDRAHIIVIGNEKGGSGKSTIAMHLAVSLMRGGLKIGTVDLDARQGTLSRYIENRRNYAFTHRAELPMPTHRAVPQSGDSTADEARLALAIAELNAHCDTIVIDTPGSYTPLSRAGHTYADTLITPLNDSFVDLDVLGRVNPQTMRITGPSHYAEMVWEIKKWRAMRDGGSMAWIVMRNRLSHLAARNKVDMERLVTELAKRIGFMPLQGLGERVIYRELFLSGLTLLDVNRQGVDVEMSLSHVAARQELRHLLEAIGTANRTLRSVATAATSTSTPTNPPVEATVTAVGAATASQSAA